jgi:uncharacterized peroxidase-related enzyme
VPHLPPLTRAELAEYELSLRRVESAMGFLPNSLLTMGRRPEILNAFARLVGAVMGPGKVGLSLKSMVAYVASTAAGCRYCQAHMATVSLKDVPPEKVSALWEFETSPLFSEAERAALRLGRDGARLPNDVTDDHFAALQPHFDVTQIVELVSVLSLFGFLNRWNDTLATTLEPEPRAVGEKLLAGWSPGKHC